MIVNAAAVFHLAGPTLLTRARDSAAVAAAWLRGAAAPEQLLPRCAVPCWEHGLPTWTKTTATPTAGILWHAAQLDLVSVERHSDYLKDAPAAGPQREQYLFAYRRDCLMLALVCVNAYPCRRR